MPWLGDDGLRQGTVWWTWIVRVLIAALLAGLLTACGGGNSGSSSTDSGSTGGSGGGTVSGSTAAMLSGTVATGNALAGANITVLDATGAARSTTSQAGGVYSLSVDGMTAPLLILATDPSGQHSPLYSVVVSIATGTGTTANVTTLTTAVTALLTSDGNPATLSGSANLSTVITATSVSAAVAKLNLALADIIAAYLPGTSSFDPIATVFTADQTGADAVIDAVTLTPTSTGGMQLASIEDASQPIVLTSSTTIASSFPAPDFAADDLSSMMTALTSCLSGTSSACSTAIDTAYLENGYQNFKSYHATLSASGSTITGYTALAVFPAGKFAAINARTALVRIAFTNSGQTYSATVLAQQTSGPTVWDIIGNQQAYNATIRSFLTRRQSLDSNNAALSRYESGLGISVPPGASGSPNPVTLAAVSVTGPGINGTAWLLPRTGTGNSLLSLTSQALTSVPTGGVTSSANTSLYRWSWQAIPGATGTYVPASSSLGFYTPAAIDTSTVPAYSLYTMTYYDASGTPIGQPMSVMNTEPVLAGASGAGVAWQSLSADTLAQLLTPGGAQSGIVSSLNVTWSSLVDGVNLAPLLNNIEIQSSSGTGVTPAASVDGWWTGRLTQAASGQYTENVVAGLDQNGTQECSTSACPFPALQAGASRLVQLGWTIGLTNYYNVFKYND